jgi:hypothetical protein
MPFPRRRKSLWAIDEGARVDDEETVATIVGSPSGWGNPLSHERRTMQARLSDDPQASARRRVERILVGVVLWHTKNATRD